MASKLRHTRSLLSSLAKPLPVIRPRPSQYHSYDHPNTLTANPYTAAEDAILSSALSHVPTHGFTSETLALGARDAGYLDVSTQLFPKGVMDLILWYLVRQRGQLGDRVQFPETQEGGRKVGVGARVRGLALERLRMNAEARVIGRWPEALAIMAQPTHIPASLKELGLLADEIWFLAGDTSVDSSWYTKRASLATVYSAAEVFMTQDQSTEYRDTEQFLDNRLEDLRTVGLAVGNVGEWLGFTAASTLNVLRSKGVRI